MGYPLCSNGIVEPAEQKGNRMYELFTDRARKVMQLANQEAQRFNHEYIGTEHILLALVKEDSGAAVTVMDTFGIDPRKIRLEVEKLMHSGPDMVTMGKLPQTARAKRAVVYSMEEARNLNLNCVGTEHILLGLLHEQEGIAGQVLMNLGLTLEKVRAVIPRHLLGEDKDDEGQDEERRPGKDKDEERLLDMLASAWGIIASAYDGDWELASKTNDSWKPAAEKWRSRWFAVLASRPCTSCLDPPSEPSPPAEDESTLRFRVRGCEAQLELCYEHIDKGSKRQDKIIDDMAGLASETRALHNWVHERQNAMDERLAGIEKWSKVGDWDIVCKGATGNALQMAATAWCAPTTSHLDMIPELAEEFARIIEAIKKPTHLEWLPGKPTEPGFHFHEGDFPAHRKHQSDYPSLVCVLFVSQRDIDGGWWEKGEYDSTPGRWTGPIPPPVGYTPSCEKIKDEDDR